MSEVTIRLMGVVRVTGPNREDLTPAGAKVTGLLALLAVADGGFCSRGWLQDKLWSDRGVKQAQDSLRHAISSLKSALGDYSDILIVQGRTLALDRTRTLIDVFDDVPEDDPMQDPANQFLAGLEVRDRQFVSWLQSVRQTLGSRRSSQRSPQSDASSVFQSGIRIGLLPVESYGTGNDADLIGNALINRAAMTLRNLGPFAIQDFSTSAATGAEATAADENVIGLGPGVSSSGAAAGAARVDAMLSVRSVQVGTGYNVMMSLRRVLDNEVIWSAMELFKSKEHAHDQFSDLVIKITDQIATVLSRPSVLGEADRHLAARLVLGGIERMFAISPNNLDEAEEAFAHAIELEKKGVYYAWRAYLLAFRSGELKAEGQTRQDLQSFANELADEAMKLDGNNPLTLALLTHVYAFVFRDYHRAHSLIEPAMTMKSDTIMAQDSYALLNFYTGNLQEAKRAAEGVYRSSVFNPYRYCFATSMCMIETVGENFELAVEYGEKAMALQSPTIEEKFAPNLRYLSAAHAHLGNLDRARELYTMLQNQEPDFNADVVEQDGYPLPNRRAVSILKMGLEKIEREDK